MIEMQQTIDDAVRAAPARSPESADATPGARDWQKVLAPYRTPLLGRGLLELAVTVVPFVALWVAMLFALSYSYWLCLILAVPAAGFLVRLFMIQHDCGHGSFFAGRKANDWLGRTLGVVTLTPYAYWRRQHAVHHATSGNLDQRGTGDIEMLTVREFQSLPLWRRLQYRLLRNPLILFGIGPFYIFVLKHRLPVGLMRSGRRPWISVMGTNLAIAVVSAGLMALVGWQEFLLIQGPVTVLASAIGVWLFYVQHQFEETYWARSPEWDSRTGALEGSSHYDLPLVLRWFTANIGIHHVHHLCSRIPCYRLNEALRDHPDLRNVSRLTLEESIRCLPLALWDEDRRLLVRFADA